MGERREVRNETWRGDTLKRYAKKEIEIKLNRKRWGRAEVGE